MSLRLEITDRDGVSLGEVQDASNRRVERALRAASTAGFTIRTRNPILEDLVAGDRRVRAYHRPAGVEKLLFHGDVVSLEAASDAQGATVSVTASDPYFWLAKRITGRDFDGDTYSVQDKLVIVKALIDASNASGETGIQTSAMTSGTLATFIAGPYRAVSECITELADSLDGFDWYIDPIEYAGGKIGNFIGDALIQTARPNAVFEYGPDTRANIRDFTYQKSWADLANSFFNLPSDLATGTVITGSDATSITEHGLAEALVETPDIPNNTLRQEVVDFHETLRKDPRQTLNFTPVVDPDQDGSVPIFDHDYFLGDLVPVRLAPEGVDLINGSVRVHKMTVEADNTGRVQYTPTTVPE